MIANSKISLLAPPHISSFSYGCTDIVSWSTDRPLPNFFRQKNITIAVHHHAKDFFSGLQEVPTRNIFYHVTLIIRMAKCPNDTLNVVIIWSLLVHLTREDMKSICSFFIFYLLLQYIRHWADVSTKHFWNDPNSPPTATYKTCNPSNHEFYHRQAFPLHRHCNATQQCCHKQANATHRSDHCCLARSRQ